MKLAAALATLLVAGSALAADVPRVRPIQFAPGTNGAVVEGSAVRGEFHLWSLAARGGQTLTARITAVENNAVFQLYAPGARVGMDDGMLEVTGKTLPGAGEGEDATRWSGRLPADGTYLFVVGGTRGNASYRLDVTVR